MKVVYFDRWTKSIPNLIDVDVALKKEGIETLLIHYWSAFDPSSPKEEVIQGIKCRDTEYYNEKYFYKILKKEKPDVVISLNTVRIYDRAIVLACRKLGIKSVFLMHGTRAFGGQDPIQYAKLLDQAMARTSERAKRAGRFISHVIPNYLFSLYKYNWILLMRLRFLRVLYFYYKKPGLAAYYPPCPDELLYDKCLLYSKSEIEYHKKIGYPEKSIQIVGNPKYDKFLNKIKNNGFDKVQLPKQVMEILASNRGYCLLLEDALPESGNVGGITNAVRNRVLNEIADRLDKDDMSLVVKIHPASDLKDFEIESKNLTIVDSSLDELIYYSTCCIVQVSTTINQCILLKKPVYHVHWDEYKNVPDNFPEVGLSRYWNNINDGLDLTVDETKYDQLIDTFVSVTEPTASKNVVNQII